MKMTRSRELLSVIMQFIIAICTLVLISSFVLNLTFSSETYYDSHFPSAKLAAECDAQLTQEYEMLAKESGFPIRVFEMVKKDMPTYQAVESAVDGVLTSDKSDFYNENLVSYFYNICEDFADGNDMQYSKADLTATAEKAARIYSDVVGIHNTDDAVQKMKKLNSKVTLAQLVSFVVAVVCSVSMILMYSRKRLGYYRFFSAVIGGSIGTIASSATVYFIKPVMYLDIEPAIYRECFSEMAEQYFMITTLIAVAFLVVSFAFTIKLERDHQKSADKVKIV